MDCTVMKYFKKNFIIKVTANLFSVVVGIHTHLSLKPLLNNFNNTKYLLQNIFYLFKIDIFNTS